MESLVKVPTNDYHEVFKKIVRSVGERLEKKFKIVVSDSFNIMMVKLVALCPDYKFVLKQPMSKDEFDRLVRITIEFITGMTQIQRNIIRMQFHYRGNHFPRAQLVHAHWMELQNQVRDVQQDLMETNPRTLRETELYFKKLVVVIATKSDIGSASDPRVFKETEAALSSAFPMEELHLLVSMSGSDREREITNLVLMTMGIRLFNHHKDSKNYGVGISDLLKILPDKIFRCASLLSEMRERCITRLIRYTTLIKPYFLDKNPSTRMGRRDVSQDMLIIRQGLVMVHQLLVYIKELSDELLDEDEGCDTRISRYHQSIEKLTTTVRDNAAVPTLIVYPSFIELAQTWKELQMSVAFMETMIELVKALVEYSENDLVQVDPIVNNLIGSLKTPTEATFFDFAKEVLPEEVSALAYRRDFTPNMDPLEMKYAGFCVWSFVKGLGLLLMGNPNLGVFRWHDSDYILATAEAAQAFRIDPEVLIYKAVLTARRWPELIFVLKLEEEVFRLDIRPDTQSRPTTALGTIISQDSSVQTELHPLESNIMPSYSWNEWEHRRRAIALSKVYRCATSSTQTHIMSLRKNQNTQTFPLKNTHVQTMKDAAVEIPMSQFYFWGLRGCHEHPPHVVELIRDCPLCISCLVPSKNSAKKKVCGR